MKSIQGIDFSPLAAEYHLELILLFGSRAAALTHGESDIDIAVLIEKGHQTPVDRLELTAAFMRLLETDKVDVVCLNDTDYFFRYEVTQHGHPLYEAREGLYGDYACLAMQRYEAHKGLERVRENLLHEQILNQ